MAISERSGSSSFLTEGIQALQVLDDEPGAKWYRGVQGIVFDQLRAYANRQGADVWSEMSHLAHVGKRTYLVTETYPDEDLDALVQAAMVLLGRSRDEVLADFGRFLASGLLAIYGVLLNKSWDLHDVLMHTEKTIHRVVRLRDPKADPPRLKISDGPGPSEVTIFYDSPRRMCWLGKGIIEGIAKEYGTDVSIADVRCMHDGDPVCEIRVQIEPASLGSR